MARAVMHELKKVYDGVAALDGFSLDVSDGELITVLGPSGCGKSTLLRLVAGLDLPTSGTIELGGRRIDVLPPEERDVAMVFQSYALYPHMTVRGNVEFPLRMRRMPREERRQRVGEVADLLEIGPVLDRRPGALSGGQRQRVALARALVRRPELFLLDEPLSNLDARLRASVRQYIREVQRRLGVTTLYVTHDQVEAMTLGNRVVVLDRGRVQQVDTPVAVYEHPANAFVAGFVGTPPMNLVPAVVQAGLLHVAEQVVELAPALREALGRALAVDAAGLGGEAQRVLVGVRPEAFTPVPAGGTASAGRALIARSDADGVEILGAETLVRGWIGASPVIVRMAGVVRDVPSRFEVPVEKLDVFSAGNGRRLSP
jgi:ABC-type sugar transport system ATPase subunit